MVIIFNIFYLLLLQALSYMVDTMVIPHFLNKQKKNKNGIMVGHFLQKNGKMKMSYGNNKKSFFLKIW